jgi:hypothetical protein
MRIKKPRRRDIVIFFVTLVAFGVIVTFWDQIKDLIAGIFA